MILKLSRFGNVLCTRAVGRSVRAKAERMLDAGEEVRFDLDGVLATNRPFCDEAFGQLAEALGAELFDAVVSFENADRTTMQTIRTVVKKRGKRAQ